MYKYAPYPIIFWIIRFKGHTNFLIANLHKNNEDYGVFLMENGKMPEIEE